MKIFSKNNDKNFHKSVDNQLFLTKMNISKKKG